MKKINDFTDEDQITLSKENFTNIKDSFRIIAIGLCASLSAIMFGYSLK